ncbi:MAG: bifunctional glutamate N-acetyltransferase/amino-acid acetyltransferase ArgJ, partial [Bacillota bacterium]|nr:bifunctional glutamate N-acetyltransferase/amino-acid acetyltransferase ArgJ [Bacillota bacterium]
GRLDLAVLFSRAPAAAAGVFTRNRVQAAPILVSRRHLAGGRARAVVVNAGCANACTGEEGVRDAEEMAALTASHLGLRAEEVLVASTGVIGVRLPMEKIRVGIAQVSRRLSPEGGQEAALAIMTTDTRPKACAVRVELGGVPVTIGGMAKGSGMIHPQMATMLAFLTTDAAVTQPALDRALRRAVNRTFNRLTVDGDTSTNDAVFLLANGLAGNRPLAEEEPELDRFTAALEAVAGFLARAIARDGEGATCLIEVRVEGAPDEEAAEAVARAVANSNLVKTAVFGRDPNWGRILCAVGYAPAEVDPGRADIYLGPVLVARAGSAHPFNEEEARAALSQEEVLIRIALHQGEASASVWTCDLSYDYVRINASYRS